MQINATPYAMRATNDRWRILMTTDTLGGVWMYTLELAQALSYQGHRVALASMGAPLTTDQQAQVRSLPGVQVFESRFKLEWMDDPWRDVAAAGEWLLQLEANVQPDIVHLNGYTHGSLPWRTPTLVVGHSCVLSWWQAVKHESAPTTWQRYQREVACGLGAADLVIAPSHAMLTALNWHYGPLSTGRVVANGRNPALFPSGVKQPLVLTVGRLWDEAKNVIALDQIAPQVRWPIYVAGDPCHPNGGTVQLVNAHFLGQLPPYLLAPWFARSAIYVLPARYEPFGLSALEAGLAGCALVLGDIPSLREVWGDAALFVPPNDTAALAATINMLIADPSCRAMLAARAYHRAHTFTPQRMVRGYLEAYAELCAVATTARLKPGVQRAMAPVGDGPG